MAEIQGGWLYRAAAQGPADAASVPPGVEALAALHPADRCSDCTDGFPAVPQPRDWSGVTTRPTGWYLLQTDAPDTAQQSACRPTTQR